MIYDKFLGMGEYGAAGMYEQPQRSLFYRKALGIRRYYEHCEPAEYNGERLYPSGVVKPSMRVAPYYLTGMKIAEEGLGDAELEEAFTADFGRFRSTVPREHTVAGDMYTHSMPNYERILKEGLLSYVPRIEKIADDDLREGLLHVVRGIENYVGRCVDRLAAAKADEKLINALRKVPLHPAENIYEALVAWNFILYLDNCDNLGCVAAGLYPYYRGENVVEELKNLFDNLDVNNGYSMALGMPYNPLTLQCLEACRGKRRPMIELFVDENTPDEVWDRAFASVRTSNGQPAFYNPHVLLSGLQKRFPCITERDVKRFCGGGCTESMLAGLSNVDSLAAGINLPLILEQTMKERLESAENFEDFYKSYMERTALVADRVALEIYNSQRARAQYNPLPMRTLLIDDCIDRGTEYNCGGARYCWSIVNFAGLINVIDSMLVIRDMVFRDKKFSPGEFLEKLARDDEAFLRTTRGYKISYGSDNAEADAFAKRISADMFSLLDGKRTFIGEGFIPASIQFMSQAIAGKDVGATPDGRRCGSPLADSLAAVFGKDVKGPTALLKSVTSLNLDRVLGVPVLNFNIKPDFGAATLKSLILGYMKLGGVQMQITCVSKQELEDAYVHPDLHRNLIVRVGGYSEYFCRLSDDLKKMVIARTVQD